MKFTTSFLAIAVILNVLNSCGSKEKKQTPKERDNDNIMDRNRMHVPDRDRNQVHLQGAGTQRC